jgi:hypothetical protein
MSEEDHDIKTNNIKIAVTAVMSVLLGAAFILALISFGMRVQTNIDNREEQKKKSDEVVTINSVDFDTTSFSYKVPESDSDTPKNYLVGLVEKNSEESYILINSKSKLEDVMNAIRGASGNEGISYDISDNFFNSGSIVAVTREASGLSDYSVKTVTRDASYNLQFDTTEKLGGDKEAGIMGRVVFVKISNIQPKGIEIKADKEE